MAYPPPYGAPPGYPPMMPGVPMMPAVPLEDARTRTVYVGNVDASMDESVLRALFSNCGTVTSVRVAG